MRGFELWLFKEFRVTRKATPRFVHTLWSGWTVSSHPLKYSDRVREDEIELTKYSGVTSKSWIVTPARFREQRIQNSATMGKNRYTTCETPACPVEATRKLIGWCRPGETYRRGWNMSWPKLDNHSPQSWLSSRTGERTMHSIYRKHRQFRQLMKDESDSISHEQIALHLSLTLNIHFIKCCFWLSSGKLLNQLTVHIVKIPVCVPDS